MGPGGPSADQVQSWLLRAGLAFVFAYAAVSMLFDPTRFTSYMPPFLPMSIVESWCIPCFAAYETLLAYCLLRGRRLVPAGLASAVTMGGIIVINPDSFEVLFRNVAIASAGLALAVQAWAKRPPGATARPDENVTPASGEGPGGVDPVGADPMGAAPVGADPVGAAPVGFDAVGVDAASADRSPADRSPADRSPADRSPADRITADLGAAVAGADVDLGVDAAEISTVVRGEIYRAEVAEEPGPMRYRPSLVPAASSMSGATRSSGAGMAWISAASPAAPVRYEGSSSRRTTAS